MSEAVEQLIEKMQEDLQSHQELASVLENKLDAMRHYDISRLEALTLSEQRLADVIGMSEGKRKEIIRRATAEVFPARGDGRATAKELAAEVDEGYKGKLLMLSSMLLEVVEKVRRLNQINKLASQKILGHFDQIFRIISQTGNELGLYGRGGKKSVMEQNRLVDAMA